MVDVAGDKTKLFFGGTAKFFCKMQQSIEQAKRRVVIAGWILNPDVPLDNHSFADVILDKCYKTPGCHVVIVIWSHWFKQRSQNPRYNQHQFIRYFQFRWSKLHPGLPLPANLHLLSARPGYASCFHDKVVVVDDVVSIGSLDFSLGRRDNGCYGLINGEAPESCGMNFHSLYNTVVRQPFLEAVAEIESAELARQAVVVVLDNACSDKPNCIGDLLLLPCFIFPNRQLNFRREDFENVRAAVLLDENQDPVPQAVLPDENQGPVPQAVLNDNGSLSCQLYRTVPRDKRYEIKEQFMQLFRELQPNEIVVMMQQYFTFPRSMLDIMVASLLAKNGHLIAILNTVPDNNPFSLSSRVIRYYQLRAIAYMQKIIRDENKQPGDYLTFLTLCNWKGPPSGQVSPPYEEVSRWRCVGMPFEKPRHLSFDASVSQILYHPRLRTNVAKLTYDQPELNPHWTLAPWGLRVGDSLKRSTDDARQSYNAGDRTILKNLAIGTTVYAVECAQRMFKLTPGGENRYEQPENPTHLVGNSAEIIEHGSDGLTRLFITGHSKGAYFIVASSARASVGSLVNTSRLQEQVACEHQIRTEVYVHAKLMVVFGDNGARVFFGGSANAHRRSLVSDTETNLGVCAATPPLPLPDCFGRDCLNNVFGSSLMKKLAGYGFFAASQDNASKNNKAIIKAIQDHAKANWSNFKNNMVPRAHDAGYISQMQLPPLPLQGKRKLPGCSFFRSSLGLKEPLINAAQLDSVDLSLPDIPEGLQRFTQPTRRWFGVPVPTRFNPMI